MKPLCVLACDVGQQFLQTRIDRRSQHLTRALWAPNPRGTLAKNTPPAFFAYRESDMPPITNLFSNNRRGTLRRGPAFLCRLKTTVPCRRLGWLIAIKALLLFPHALPPPTGGLHLRQANNASSR